MTRKTLFLTAMVVLFSAEALAYNVKGYQWGRPLEEVRRQVESRGKKASLEEKKAILTFGDKVFGKECRVTLLFTPRSRVLAGIAMVWQDPSVVETALDNLTKKYGPPGPSSGAAKDRKYYIWYSPTSRYDRIALIGGPNRTVLGYYGGEYFRRYEDETAQDAVMTGQETKEGR